MLPELGESPLACDTGAERRSNRYTTLGVLQIEPGTTTDGLGCDLVNAGANWP